ncbi:MAG: UDP-3-O-(3-hydroxymyristoyl)glucosamine N-acyltransferase [Gemmatimonadaceae bacterium]
MTRRDVPHDAVGGEGPGVLTAAAVAEAVGGTLEGRGDSPVRALAPLDRAGEGDLSFLASGKYAALLARATGSVVLVSPELRDTPGNPAARIIVDRPHEAMLAIIPRLHRPPRAVPGVDPTARLGRGVQLGDDVSVGAYAVIGDGARLGRGAVIGSHCVVGAGVAVGEGTQLFPHVTLYPGTTLGARVILHAGVRAGSDGFGYVFREGRHEKISHVGRCIIEDDVEVGANTTIDRGSIDDTVIGAGTKIDNLVQVAHNVRIGRLCVVVSQAGIAGSTRIEDGAVIGGQAGLGGHITIGRGAKIAGQAGVFGDVPAGETWSGYPARPHREALRAQAALFRLPALLRGLERLLARDDATPPEPR